MEPIDILWAPDFNTGFGDLDDFKEWYRGRFGTTLTDSEAEAYLVDAQIRPPEN